MRVFGLILTGGSGSRLGGVDKARLRLGPNNLLNTLINSISDQTELFALSSGLEKLHSANQFECLVDPFVPQIGPLGGMYAGGLWASEKSRNIDEDTLLIAPVDTPHFPTDFVAHAKPMLNDADVVLGSFGEQTYPVCGLWRISALLQIGKTRQTAKNNSIRAFMDTIRVSHLDYKQYSNQDPFRNVNKITDLLALSPN